METHKICSFFGHREIEVTKELKNILYNTIIDLIENKDVKTFLFGGFGMFDDLCWQIVTYLKNKYTNIRRVYCLEDSRYLNKLKRPKYLLDCDYEDFIYLPLDYDYWYKRIYYRNCAMIDHSEYVIMYCQARADSGAYKAYKYALKQKHLKLVNLYDYVN